MRLVLHCIKDAVVAVSEAHCSKLVRHQVSLQSNLVRKENIISNTVIGCNKGLHAIVIYVYMYTYMCVYICICICNCYITIFIYVSLCACIYFSLILGRKALM